jgi:hypothetical protein
LAHVGQRITFNQQGNKTYRWQLRRPEWHVFARSRKFPEQVALLSCQTRTIDPDVFPGHFLPDMLIALFIRRRDLQAVALCG